MTPLLRSLTNKLITSAWFQSFVLGVGLTLVFLWPVIQHFSTHLPSRADGVLISYLIYWVGQALGTGQNLYQVPFFYPFASTLAYSDPFLTSGIFSWPLTLVTSNLVSLSNTSLVVGTVLSVMGMYLLVWELTRSKTAGVLSALVFTFSSLHFHYLVHLHTYLIAGLPFSLYFFVKWLRSDRWWYLVATGLAFLGQTLNAPMTGFFLAFIFLPFAWQADIRRILRQRWQAIVVSLTVIGIICAGFYYPYFQVSQTFKYTRSIRDAAAGAHSLNFLIQPEVVILVGLAVIGWYIGKRQRQETSLTVKDGSILVMTLIGAVLMFGPVLKLNDQTFKVWGWPIPLPYAVLYYLVPGFKAFRTSSRWVIVFNFGLSLLLGKYWGQIHHSKPTQWLMIIGVGVWLWLHQVPNLPLFAIPQTLDPIYDQVKARPEKILVEFPVLAWNMPPYNLVESDRLLRQAYHGKTLHNGASGFTPPEREQEWSWLWQLFPEPETLEYLKNEGVELMLVDYGLYREMQQAEFTLGSSPTPDVEVLRARLANEQRLELLSCSQTACLYTILK